MAGVQVMIGGFHVAALVAHDRLGEAHELLVRLAEVNRQGETMEWGFNEWMHGRSGHAMGFDQQAWSAAMYLYADHAVRTGELPLFDQLRAVVNP